MHPIPKHIFLMQIEKMCGIRGGVRKNYGCAAFKNVDKYFPYSMPLLTQDVAVI